MPPPPPPVTPSPHRFVIKKPPPAKRTPLTQEQPRPSTQQFKATPRFNFSSTPRPTPSQTLPLSTPSATRYFTPARPTSRYEDIVDISSDGLQDLQNSIEADQQEIDQEYLSADTEDNYAIEERTPKRRRISSSPLLLEEDPNAAEELGTQDSLPDPRSPPLPILSSPVTRRPISSTAPRFLISTPAPQPTPQATQTAFLKPPRFRPPDPSEQTQSQTEPLPEQFSPHRRGQKYVAGGLAAEVRDWLVNIESIPSNAAQKSKDDPWLVRLVIDEISGGPKAGMTMVRGRKVHSIESAFMLDTLGILKVILAGEGAGTGLQKGSRVEVGKTVGIKGPVWEIVIEGEKWGVGVDWKVLS